MWRRISEDAGDWGLRSRMISEDEEPSPFKEGARVEVVVIGLELMKEVGTVVKVIDTGPRGTVSVLFADGIRKTKVELLRPAENTTPMASLGAGECYGELSLLYNTRELATCRSTQPSVVFAISGKHFKECFGRQSRQSKTQEIEWIKLLDEVQFLSSLLRSERAEVARNAAGIFCFEPGEMVLQQGQVQEQLWYILDKGSGDVTTETYATGEPRILTTLRRGNHFGERAIFRGERQAEFSVKAGLHGMTCLVIDGEIIKNLKLDVDWEQIGMPGVQCEVVEYHKSSSSRASKMAENIPFEELERCAVLGEGGFGAVYLVRRNGVEYALKRLSKGYITQADAEKQVCTEREILSLMDSTFIIRFYQTYKDDEYVYMLLELAGGGHLYRLLRNHSKVLLSDTPRGSAAMFFTASVIGALEFLHERSIAYRDLKLENVLLDSLGYVKLCDLGFAKFVLGKTHTLLGTAEYMAPEMIDPPHAHDSNVDWWALGVMSFELLTGQAPWDNMGIDDDPMGQLIALRESHDRGVPEGFLHPSLNLAKDFIKRLLVVNPKRRLGRNGAAEVRQCAWFTSCKFDFVALAAQTLEPPYIPPQRTLTEDVRPATESSVSVLQRDHNKLFVKSNGKADWADCF
ncbi:unnamed protein product [Polarella glacialis]|uniref:cGMP-dependent protein kinase n=2 Tax=Polarella glacialis TaxID=89957 RepID=A0A813HY76_POLGL|nr:unnamed protein product [Polarella glacialis]